MGYGNSGLLGFEGYFTHPCRKGRSAININRCSFFGFMTAKKRFFLQKSINFEKNYYICPKFINYFTMKNKFNFIIGLLVIALLFCSCAPNANRAMRKAEHRMERQEKQAKKQYSKAKSSHYKRQAKKTKRMMKKDKQRAERLRRRQRSNPYF